MRVADFDYHLPHELIAQEPLERRDGSRLMVVPKSGAIEHRTFRDIVDYLRPPDTLVVNDTRVMKARLLGTREETGGKMEVLLLSRTSGSEGNDWETLVRPGRRAQPGARLAFGAGLRGEVLANTPYGGRIVRFQAEGEFDHIVEQIGHVPLPPYIKRGIADPERYQTVYAQRRGSAAAPTAGLHFTPDLLRSIAESGTAVVPITLHVGLGTFRPVKVATVEEHVMHSEHFVASEEATDAVNRAKAGGGRVVAVGTTTVRTLESLPLSDDGKVRASTGWTTRFIYPGYAFRAVDAILTNFHLPRSTLLMLVCAFGGRDRIMAAYELAVKERYRFFSFGDAMLLL